MLVAFRVPSTPPSSVETRMLLTTGPPPPPPSSSFLSFNVSSGLDVAKRKKVDREDPKSPAGKQRKEKRENLYTHGRRGTLRETHTHTHTHARICRSTCGFSPVGLGRVEKQPSFPSGSTVDDDLLVKTVLSLKSLKPILCGFTPSILTVHQVEYEFTICVEEVY